MTATLHNARYTKLRRLVWKVHLNIRNLVRRGVANLRLLRSRADLSTHRASQKQIVSESSIQFLGITSHQPHILALYV